MRWKRFKIIFDWLQDGWSLVLLLVPGAGTAVSVVTSYAAHEPWHLILFWASGVFCFGMVAISTLSSWMRDNTVSGKLKPDFFTAIIGRPNIDDVEIFVAICSIKIFNKGLYDLYYKLQDAELSLSGKTSEDNMIYNNTVMLIQSGSETTMAFPSILGVKPEPMEGRLKLTLQYGKSKNSLPYTFYLLATPQVHVYLNGKGEIAGTLANFLIKDMKYT